MNLSTYLAQNKMTATAFAERLDVSTATVTRWARGERNPSLAQLKAIHQHTKGAVTPYDFMEMAP